MKKILLALIVLSIILLAGCKPAAEPKVETNISEPVETPKIIETTSTGNFHITIKDKQVESDSISKLIITIEKLEVLKEGENQWQEILDEDTPIDLITLKDTEKLLATKALLPGTYNKIRLIVDDDVDAVIDDETVNVELPSGKLTLAASFTIIAGQDTSAQIDFDIENAVIKAGKQYILKPILHAVTKKNAAIKVEGEKVTVTGETVDTETFTYEQLIPEATLKKKTDSCKDDCDDYCDDLALKCVSDCGKMVSFACNIGGDSCRESCDPLLPVYKCRDACKEDTVTKCEKILNVSCVEDCAAPAGCLDECNTACET